jgi:hypothetical protein
MILLLIDFYKCFTLETESKELKWHSGGVLARINANFRLFFAGFEE